MITVYSKNNCMQCLFVKKWLDEHGLDYLELNCSKDKNYIDEVREMGFQSLPVIKVEGHEAFCGFNPDKLEECFL